MKQKSSKASSDSFTTGWELNWGGLEVWGISVQLWEPSVKNLNHFLSLLLPSHSRFPCFCFLSPTPGCSFLYSSVAERDMHVFFIHHHSGIKFIVKEEQLVQSCVRWLDSWWTDVRG